MSDGVKGEEGFPLVISINGTVCKTYHLRLLRGTSELRFEFFAGKRVIYRAKAVKGNLKVLSF